MRNVRPLINIYLHDDIMEVKKCEFPIPISGKQVGHKADKKTIENSLVCIVHVWATIIAEFEKKVAILWSAV